MPSAAAKTQQTTHETSGGRLVCTDGRALPLTGASVSADARAGLLRLTLEQTFRNPYQEPLRVTYSLPLPADGAVSGFSFRVGQERIVGEIDTKKQARQRFEEAILDGRTAAILDQERSSVFTQEVGNVPPLTEVVCEVQIDQKLAWLPDGCWEWRFPTVVAPRYLGASGRVADAASISVDVGDAALPVKLGLSLSIRDQLIDGTRPDSPSHALHSARALGRTDVTFADERGIGLDRDVVVRWRVAVDKPVTSLDVYEQRGRLFGLLTLTPPRAEAKAAPVPRDLIVLLDTSGSMSGSPIDQARKLTQALVDSLGDDDQLELIEFSMTARRWKRGPVFATASNRRDAQAWLARLQASGGTEMRTGILEALAPLRPDAQRQVILVTDGLIGFESEIVQTIAHQLPRGSRVHTIGVGSGVNRSLTAPAARAGRGLELVMGLGEDVEVAAQRLLARTNRPLVTNVEISGTAVRAVAPARVPDLYAGAPALISVELDPRGGTLTITGDVAGGRLEETLRVSSSERAGNASLATLFAREQVEDLELSLAAGALKQEIDVQIERLGLAFQISTRLTSWIAVSASQTVDPRAPRRTETMPQTLPFGMSAEGLGLRAAAPVSPTGRFAMSGAAAAGPNLPSTRSAPQAPQYEAVDAEDWARPPSAKRPSSRGRRPEPHSEVPPEAEESAAELDAGAPEGGAGQADDRAKSGALPPPASSSPPAPARVKAPAPAKEEAQKQKKTFGLFELAKDLFGGLVGGEAPSPTGDAPASNAPVGQGQAQRTTRTLRGQLVRVTDQQTVIELEVEGEAVDWAPEAQVRVELEGGALAFARVDLTRTTAPGHFGQGLRLTLVLEGSFGTATLVRIGSLDIALRT